MATSWPSSSWPVATLREYGAPCVPQPETPAADGQHPEARNRRHPPQVQPQVAPPLQPLLLVRPVLPPPLAQSWPLAPPAALVLPRSHALLALPAPLAFPATLALPPLLALRALLAPPAPPAPPVWATSAAGSLQASRTPRQRCPHAGLTLPQRPSPAHLQHVAPPPPTGCILSPPICPRHPAHAGRTLPPQLGPAHVQHVTPPGHVPPPPARPPRTAQTTLPPRLPPKGPLEAPRLPPECPHRELQPNGEERL